MTVTDIPPIEPVDPNPEDVAVIDAESDDPQSDTDRFSEPVMFRPLTPQEARDLEKREITF